jgi:hypothetical protein
MAGPGIFPSPGYHITVQRPAVPFAHVVSFLSLCQYQEPPSAGTPTTTPLPPSSPTPGSFPSAGENVRVGLSLRNEIPRGSLASFLVGNGGRGPPQGRGFGSV